MELTFDFSNQKSRYQFLNLIYILLYYLKIPDIPVCINCLFLCCRNLYFVARVKKRQQGEQVRAWTPGAVAGAAAAKTGRLRNSDPNKIFCDSASKEPLSQDPDKLS